MRAFICAVALAALLALAADGLTRWPPCDEQIVLTAPPGAIEILHNNVEYNCCSWTDIEIVQQAFTVEFYEWERFALGPCFCLCCLDLETAAGGFVSSEYMVRLREVFFEVPPRTRTRTPGREAGGSRSLSQDLVPCYMLPASAPSPPAAMSAERAAPQTRSMTTVRAMPMSAMMP